MGWGPLCQNAVCTTAQCGAHSVRTLCALRHNVWGPLCQNAVCTTAQCVRPTLSERCVHYSTMCRASSVRTLSERCVHYSTMCAAHSIRTLCALQQNVLGPLCQNAVWTTAQCVRPILLEHSVRTLCALQHNVLGPLC